MINILSLNCGLAFATYLAESASEFLNHGQPISRSIRQGGSGLIIRSAAQLAIRHQNREAELGGQEARHYLATVQSRIDAFDIARTSDEIVLASFGGNLFLSHPQSDLWLDRKTVESILALANPSETPGNPADGLPEWLRVSTGAERLLISDQRNGRWVLLGLDHIAELERRLASLSAATHSQVTLKPPTLLLKGLTIHLQSARRLVQTMQRFADTGEVLAFDDVAPQFSLRVKSSTEGLEINDSSTRIGINTREARKWAAIIDAELSRLRVTDTERGSIRTVFADGEGGRWALQWGDEVLVPAECVSNLTAGGSLVEFEEDSLAIREAEDFIVLLSRRDSSCVALTPSEINQLNSEP